MQKIKYTPSTPKEKQNRKRLKTLCKILGWIIVIFNGVLFFIPTFLAGNPFLTLNLIASALGTSSACASTHTVSLICVLGPFILIAFAKIVVGIIMGIRMIKGDFEKGLLIADILLIAAFFIATFVL